MAFARQSAENTVIKTPKLGQNMTRERTETERKLLDITKEIERLSDQLEPIRIQLNALYKEREKLVKQVAQERSSN